MATLQELKEKIKRVMDDYQVRHPEVRVNEDYFPLKVSEEWGECLQAYLMMTSRGRQKGKSKEEIREEFSKEVADVFGFLLLFADKENIDIEKELEKKWFTHLT